TASAGSTRSLTRCAASPGCPSPQPSDTHIRPRSGTLSTGIISQAARSPHGVDNGCTLREAQGGGDVETEVLVERHVFQLRGFEVGGQPHLITSLQPRAQQGRANPASLPDRIDPDECQVPMWLFARMGGDRHGLIPPDDGKTTAEGPQIAGEGGPFGPEWGAGREPHGGSGYAPVDTGHFHCAVAKRLMVQFGHEKASQSLMPRALSRKEPA